MPDVTMEEYQPHLRPLNAPGYPNKARSGGYEGVGSEKQRIRVHAWLFRSAGIVLRQTRVVNNSGIHAKPRFAAMISLKSEFLAQHCLVG